MANIAKERYIIYLSVMSALTAIFAFIPDILQLIGLPPRENWELAIYIALFRSFFLITIALAAWKFSFKGGLITCSVFIIFISLPLIIRFWDARGWLEMGVILLGIIFSVVVGYQGKLKILLEKNAEEFQQQAARLNLEIAERKLTECKIRESEKRYRLLAENATDVIWTVNIDNLSKVTYISPSVTRLLGYSVEEAMAKRMEDVFSPASIDYSIETLKEVLAEEKESPNVSRTLEVDLVHKDGTIIPVEINGSVIYDHDRKPSGILVIARDSTIRKQAEERIKNAAKEWRITFDSIKDFVSIHDKDRKILRVNTAFAENFGLSPKEVIGKYCYNIIHGGKDSCTSCPFKKTLKTKKSAWAEFYEPHLGIHMHVSTSPIFNSDGEITGVVHIARDISERKQMEEQLIMTDRLASIGELVSGVAHELNNPLTSVIGFSQLVMEENISEDVRNDLDIVHSEARRAAQIVKNLLTFARKHAPVKQISQVNSIIEDVLRLRAYEQKVNNIEVINNCAPDLPQIMVDYFQMQQVFLNIITNAEHAMIDSHNGGTLTITTEQVDSFIRVSLADDGPGIPKQNMSQIFTPFYTTKEVGKGTGLGLSICHGIIAGHNGKLYAESKKGKGATFFIELPAINEEKHYIDNR